jgi:hypothetical protein
VGLLALALTASAQTPDTPGPSGAEGFRRVDAPVAGPSAGPSAPRPTTVQDDDTPRARRTARPEVVPRAREAVDTALAPLEPQTPSEAPITVSATPSPAPNLKLTPNLGGVDPMIAVGHTAIIVSQDHRWAYFDKNGSPLPGSPPEVSSTDFFQPVIDQANTTFGLAAAPDALVDLCADPGDNPTKLITEAYDTRVAYEPVNRRFVILSALRNRIWRGDSPLCSVWAVRSFAFAISNTENPLDGFKMWFWTKNNYRDWPRMSVDKDVLTVAHNAKGDEGTPSIYVISLQDMMNGSSDPRWFTYRSGVGDTPEAVLPVAKYPTPNHTTFDDYVLYLRGDGDNVFLHYFRKAPFMWQVKPALGETDMDLGNDVSFAWNERPVLRRGSLYFTSRVLKANSLLNFHPRTYGFDLYRLPLKKDGNELEFNESSPKKLEYPVYPGAPAAKNFVSYEAPALSVDARGTILAAYGRVGRTAHGDIAPEARYFVFREGETQHRPSRLLQGGNVMLTFTPPGWTEAVPDGHYNYGDADDVFIDYATVAPDPDKRFVFWIAHAFADSKSMRYNIVVGRVFAP